MFIVRFNVPKSGRSDGVVYVTNNDIWNYGPSIKNVTLFLANFDPPPPVTLCHTSRFPPKVRHTSRTTRFLVGLVQKSRTKVPCTNSISIVRGGLCSEGFVRVGFCPLPLLSQYICYNRKLNITLNFMFHMYDTNLYKRDFTCSLPPPPVTNCHTFSDPLPPRA